ncbi:MAG: ACT domain-containing protein [Planctomycetota bacterium]
MTSLVLTVIGPDRPGLVQALSDTIKRHDANWLESEMSQLVGQFAGIVHVQVAEAEADTLTAELVNLQNKGLSVKVTPAAEADAEYTETNRAYTLELLGLDRPGIVRDLAQALAARSINVAQLKTHTESAPMSGELMFRATSRLHVPVAASHDELHDALDQLAADLDLDLNLSVAE